MELSPHNKLFLYMRKLNEYIIEKLKINKNSKIKELTDEEFLDADPKDYLFVAPTGYNIKDLINKYGETYIISGNDETKGWILPKDEADNDEFIKLYDVFNIPSKYDTIVQFMRDYESGNITIMDLELI